MGQAPGTGTVSLRTFPRNFPGRSGTLPDRVYLCSPETAVAAAIFGKITDPRKLGESPEVSNPEHYIINDENLVFPPEDPSLVEISMGPNIKPFPHFGPLEDTIEGQVILRVGDNITTDHVMPAGSKILPFRSNIEAISQFVFSNVDGGFAHRALDAGTGFVVGGDNYGQGSSREHAAIAPRFLGIRAKLVKSFARIHKANLINFGILPLTFVDPADYDAIEQGGQVRFEGIRDAIQRGEKTIVALLPRSGRKIHLNLDVTDRERDILLAGGLINLVSGH
jgi:aconitate hydratase